MSNESLYDAALESIDKLFGDRSVSIETTKENLETLAGEIEIRLDSLGD